MQREVSIEVQGRVLRGTAHVPDNVTARVPAVILFHGFTGTRLEAHRLFLKVSRFLETRGIASFRFDFSGSGESDGSFADMTVSSELREAHAILDFVRAQSEVDTSRVTVCGLSLGGLVASLLAQQRSADIWQLVLVAPAGNIKQIVEEMIQHNRGLADARVFDYAGNPVGRAFAEEVLQMDPFAQATGYPGNVLLIHGTKDARVPVSVSQRYLAETYGGRGRLIRIEGANHTFDGIHWEDELMQAIAAYVRDGTRQ